MQKIIEQILEGNYDYENGSLDFSCAKIELSLQRGEVMEGSFRIFAPEGRFASGTVSSSDLRMECLTGEFTGSGEEIFFRFHGEELEEGDVVKGSFYVVSNQGEYYLPFVATVEYPVLESSAGVIRNLFHFANLAKENWQEALSLFYSPDFTRVFSGSDAQYREDYRALSVYEGSEQNMEEFLILVNKKQRVEFLVQEDELTLDAAQAAELADTVTQRDLTLARSGWGYTRLFIECTGDFLFTEKEMLTDDDFLGNRCVLPVFIDGSLCREGRNFGRICLYNSYVSLTVPVTVRIGERAAAGTQRLTEKRDTVQLMELYQAFRSRKIGTNTWLKETGKLVEKQVALDENDPAARLFQAQLLITEERYNEAGWILDYVAERLERGAGDDALLAYYLYLTTLIHREEEYIKQAAARVEYLYRRNDGNWRVGWLLLYLSQEYQRSASAKWLFLEKQYARGCRSPVLYFEAAALLNTNPSLLRRLGEFERQVVWYGARQGFLKQEAVEQLLYLCDKVRDYSGVLYRTLEKLYEKKNDVRILQQVCTLLIKGGKTGEKWFSWYSAGVENNLRITNLYEYYMMSLDLEKRQEIPKLVLLYFSYQNNLDYERTAYLYDYILSNEERLGDLGDTYRMRMEYFCLDQISRLHINRNLASLYNRLVQPGMLTEANGGAFSRLLFAHMIRAEDDRLRKVYVYQPGNPYPAEYSLNGGRAWVSLYGGSYTIAFEDAWKNRFVRNVEYTIEKLMIPGKFLRSVLPFVSDNPELELYLTGDGPESGIDSPEGAERALRVMASGYADDAVIRRLTMLLLQYYYDAERWEELDDYLLRVPYERLSREERGTVVRLLVLRGNMERAEEWMRRGGPYFIDPKLLVRLLGVLMDRRGMGGDELLTAAAMYAFGRGRCDSVTTRYLALHYQGLTKNLRDIWKAADGFGLDCVGLAERMLVQMLYSGAFVGENMEIFRYYISHGAKPEVEEAFLARYAFEYFAREQLTGKEIFDEIQRMYYAGEPVQKICQLACLKYYAENRGELTKEAAGMTDVFLERMMNQGIRLEFFREYRENRRVAWELADKTIVEYRAEPGARACIHYVLIHENGEADEYRAEYMREACGGVCFQEFILFFGERIQYYITEEREDGEQLTESGSLQRSDVGSGGSDSRYHLVNDILLGKSLEDYETMDHLLEEYHRKEFLNGRLFELK
ncbi:MAG: DUF5717 family protein [Roseburia sp.]|nr:DUF5717 family protein [Roseburia sp.]MCM1097278.1 DUF5717 family protein [Ruminococcus flavefaciens]